MIQTHPEKNLYFTVPQLGLPQLLQSSLLFYAVQNYHLVPSNEEQKFLQEIKEGNTENAQHFIQLGVDIHVQDENDMTPLMIASQSGQTKLVEQLIRAGADVNHQNSSGDTALIYAFKDLTHFTLLAMSKNINHMEKIQECVQVLLQHQAEINIQGKDGNTALMHAANKTSCYLEQFQKSKIKSNIKNFTRDEEFADMEKCMFSLIDAGADPSLKNDRDSTALILGANILNFVKKMIKTGVDINWEDKDGKTALTQAAASGNIECIETLIEAGAEINRGSPTPLMAAAKDGHVECVKLLIQEGADLNIRNENGYTALIFATLSNSGNSFFTLLKAGAELDSSLGTPVLHNIAAQTTPETNSKDNRGKILNTIFNNFRLLNFI